MRIIIEIETNGFVQGYQAINRLKLFGCKVVKVETDNKVFQIDESKEETKVNKIFSENFGRKKSSDIKTEPVDQGEEK